MHAGHNSQPRPVTILNAYTFEFCNEFLYLGVTTNTPLNVVQKKLCRVWFTIGKHRHIFIFKISDANRMCLFKATVETIAAYGLEAVPIVLSANRCVPSSNGPGCVGRYLAQNYIDCRTHSVGHANSLESCDPQASNPSCWPRD